jgi:hypothetical protein
MTRFYLFIARWSLKVNAWARRKACPETAGRVAWLGWSGGTNFNDEFHYSTADGHRMQYTGSLRDPVITLDVPKKDGDR